MAESMKGLKRTCRCAELSEQNIGDTVTVMGWVQKQRNKGGIIFVDLRDRSGILQLIFEESEIGSEGFAKAEKLRSEFVVAVTGEVTARSGAVNALPILINWQPVRSRFVLKQFVCYQSLRHRHSRLRQTARPKKTFD